MAVSFDDFVAASQASLFRTAVALTGGDVGSAQDLVQSALARCWLGWGRVSAASSPLAYAKRTLYTTFISDRRKRRPAEQLGPVPDASDQLGSGFDLDVLAAIRALPTRQRAVIVARYLDDLSEVEAARQLKCTVGTIKSQTFKALRALHSSPWLTDDPQSAHGTAREIPGHERS